MISEQLQKKIDRSIRLLQSVANGYDGEIEVAYSGGKDSDVILQLAKEAGIKYRAIYKNTTIDPPGTIKHVMGGGIEMLMPRDKMTFFKLVEKAGFPNMYSRHCCKFLKEYKVLDKAIIGVRKSESRNRANIYNEPTQCRYFGSKREENRVEQIMPILDWTDDDVRDFIVDRGVVCAPIYYDKQGEFHVERRLGCMCCPIKSKKKRLEDFKQYPNMVKAYVKAGEKFLDTHPEGKTAKRYSSVYDWLLRDIFFEDQREFDEFKSSMFGCDCKKYLEDYFNIKL